MELVGIARNGCCGNDGETGPPDRFRLGGAISAERLMHARDGRRQSATGAHAPEA
ncbi:hypothetical protein ABIF65_006522 [Bradyrhizobium japonicum]|jgi:hypothetical protein|uniref:hypothetical protein n=1 Tax=Bradyrhizobium TaxID=374 RepID=UPI00040027F1|nr:MULTISPECIES: hypothetical protein [Bradyrhizobium]MBR0880901.1 hypothetical protein [Bradyrhizobium liaoningense]MBR0946797.1 hypothetical protein [Bradyrhizobium liaoningense]MBR1032903.1 hypothetical protein [Bradyrhizobium liaoningense]MBR1068193.1 hypothetical protein [Bradyrhizobium liaoningense]MCP1783151.1 hypothetical protein [Bradyrhizobium japonicum]